MVDAYLEVLAALVASLFSVVIAIEDRVICGVLTTAVRALRTFGRIRIAAHGTYLVMRGFRRTGVRDVVLNRLNDVVLVCLPLSFV